MKLTIDEVAFLVNVIENSTIKGSDALFVGELHSTLSKEFTKLQKKQDDDKIVKK